MNLNEKRNITKSIGDRLIIIMKSVHNGGWNWWCNKLHLPLFNTSIFQTVFLHKDNILLLNYFSFHATLIYEYFFIGVNIEYGFLWLPRIIRAEIREYSIIIISYHVCSFFDVETFVFDIESNISYSHSTADIITRMLFTKSKSLACKTWWPLIFLRMKNMSVTSQITSSLL